MDYSLSDSSCDSHQCSRIDEMLEIRFINVSTFHAELVEPLGWRPIFRYYDGWLSVTGAILSVVVVCLRNWPTTLVTFGYMFSYSHFLSSIPNPDIIDGSSDLQSSAKQRTKTDAQ
ncbi:hypothetical protein OUZ56_016963 [Daphnia magna]|uniref:Retrieval of early ER protein Rer1 n=1 Tax=Daphnia magna TaxID=35525 RepID=A0ABR0ARS4_9CRUS|nr:hypothetical protein OUZ56_016963 [Daphnia magna]